MIGSVTATRGEMMEVTSAFKRSFNLFTHRNLNLVIWKGIERQSALGLS